MEATAEASILRATRRAWLGFAFVVALAAVALLFVLLRAGGGPAGGGGRSGSVHLGHGLAQLAVPMDWNERHWRASVKAARGHAISRARALEIREHVLDVVEATGATPLRLTIWRRTSPAAVELVAATREDRAAYLRHRLPRIVHLLRWPVYVKIVDSRGKSFFEWGGAANSGFVGVPLSLQSCSPIVPVSEIRRPPPCPAK